MTSARFKALKPLPKPVAFEEKIGLICPFCTGGVVRVGYSKHPETGVPCAAILHTDPPCEDFMRDEPPNVFVRRAREKMVTSPRGKPS